MTKKQKPESKNENMNQFPLWMDAKQLGNYLNISRSKLNQLLKYEDIPYTRLGDNKRSGLLFNRKEIDYWLLLKKDYTNKRERKKVKDYISEGGE